MLLRYEKIGDQKENDKKLIVGNTKTSRERCIVVMTRIALV